MLKVLHGADFHLDAPFRALPPEKAAQRREEQRDLLLRLADTVREQGVELVLLAGDLLDSEQIYGETAQLLARALGSMGVPVFLAPGNHDFWSPRSPYARIQWPENVHIFHSSQVEAVPLPRLGCTVYGAAFTAPARADRVLEGFRAEGEGLRLMVLHGSTEPTDRYGPVPAADIAASGLDYLALGHVHTASGLNRTGDTWCAYAGCQEGRRFDTVFLDPPYRLGLEQKTLAGLCRGGLLQEDAWIIVEAALETDSSWAEDLGLAVIREKRYKTNKHVFLSQDTE